MCPNEPPIKIDVLRVFGKALIIVFGGMGLTLGGILMGTILVGYIAEVFK